MHTYLPICNVYKTQIPLRGLLITFPNQKQLPWFTFCLMPFFSLLLITTWEGLINPFYSALHCSALQRVVQTTQIIKLPFPISQFLLLFPHYLASKNVSRLVQVGSRNWWNFPSSNSLCSSLPFCAQLLHGGGESS